MTITQIFSSLGSEIAYIKLKYDIQMNLEIKILLRIYMQATLITVHRSLVHFPIGNKESPMALHKDESYIIFLHDISTLTLFVIYLQ
jgi:hypothetical protein